MLNSTCPAHSGCSADVTALGNLRAAHYPATGNNRRHTVLQQWINSRESDVPLSDASSSEDTIELELSVQQALSLSRAAAATRPHTPPVAIARKSLPTTLLPADRRGAWSAAIFSIAATSVLSGGIVYLGTTPAEPLHVSGNTVVRSAAAAETALPPSVDTVRVKFINPFDATEAFDFPSNTSETEARQAVAHVLLQRAHERQKAAKTTRQRRNAAAAEQVVPVRAIQSHPTQLTRAGRLQVLSAGERPSL